MNGSTQGDAPTGPTTKLSFDDEIDERDIPLFLRRQKYRNVSIAIGEEPSNVIPMHEPQTRVVPVIPAEIIGASIGIIDADNQAPIEEEHTMLDNVETVEAAKDQFVQPALDGLSVEDLIKQEEAIKNEIARKQAEEKKAVIAQIVEVVTNFKIPIEEVVEALGGMKFKRKGVKAVAKYRDPATGAEWSGRGKEPIWIRDQDRTKFEIN